MATSIADQVKTTVKSSTDQVKSSTDQVKSTVPERAAPREMRELLTPDQIEFFTKKTSWGVALGLEEGVSTPWVGPFTPDP